VDVLLVVVEEFVLFLGESIGLEGGCEGVIGRWIDVGEDIRLFTFVHYGGEVEGVGAALFSAEYGSQWSDEISNGEFASYPLSFGCFALACLMYLSPSTNRFHR
jgi:hypothetical protein